MSELRHPEWQKSYQEALLEADKEKLEAKIHLAEWKIFQRLQTISADSDHHGEKSAIADALNALLVLKRDTLNYPDSMPIMNGLEAAPRLRRILPDTPIILYTLYAPIKCLEADASKMGISLIASKDEPLQSLVSKVESLVSGK